MRCAIKCADILKRFLLYPFKEIANFKSEKERAVNKTLMLVAYPLPDKGYRYPIRRGSGLFISLIGVWRCLLEDKQEIIPRFFRITTKRQIRNGGDTQHNKMEKLQKYLMLLLVTTLSLTFTACSDDDEPSTDNLSETNSIVGKWVDGDQILTLGKDGSYREDGSLGQYRIGTYSYNHNTSIMTVKVEAIAGMNSAYSTNYIVQTLSATTLVLLYTDGDVKGYYTIR